MLKLGFRSSTLHWSLRFKGVHGKFTGAGLKVHGESREHEMDIARYKGYTGVIYCRDIAPQ